MCQRWQRSAVQNPMVSDSSLLCLQNLWGMWKELASLNEGTNSHNMLSWFVFHSQVVIIYLVTLCSYLSLFSKKQSSVTPRSEIFDETHLLHRSLFVKQHNSKETNFKLQIFKNYGSFGNYTVMSIATNVIWEKHAKGCLCVNYI